MENYSNTNFLFITCVSEWNFTLFLFNYFENFLFSLNTKLNDSVKFLSADDKISKFYKNFIELRENAEGTSPEFNSVEP